MPIVALVFVGQTIERFLAWVLGSSSSLPSRHASALFLSGVTARLLSIPLSNSSEFPRQETTDIERMAEICKGCCYVVVVVVVVVVVLVLVRVLVVVVVVVVHVHVPLPSKTNLQNLGNS